MSWTGDLKADFSRNANRLDGSAGVVKYDLKSVYSTENKEMEYVLESRAAINNFQRFFTRCKGRWKSFYAPTWLNDLELAADAGRGQNFLLVTWPLFWQYYANMMRRKLAIVFLKNGQTKILPIAGYSTDTEGELGKVFLESSLSEPLRRTDVVMISFLCRCRFTSDALIVDYEMTGTACSAATISTSFTEVNT